MLIAITLRLESATPATLPAHLGRANYAATLAALGRLDPALAELVHAGDGPKPLTCSSILNARSDRSGLRIEAEQPYFVRITGLIQPVSEGLHAALLDALPERWELDKHSFRVTGAICDADADAWSGTAGYEALMSGQLMQAARPNKRVTLKFIAPTAFKSAGMTVPIPLPGLVFGSLAERWNAFSPVQLSPEMRRFGEEMVAISRYQLQSRPVVQKQGGLRMGGVGEVTYAALSNDRYWLALMQALGDFARFSGVGVQTATGMGQCRRIG